MFSLTRQERQVLLFIGVLILAGSVIRFWNVSSSLKKNSQKHSAPVKEIININTASQSEIETLQGIGPALAIRIIEYRDKYGEFKKNEDLEKIPGIGPKKLGEINNYISF